MTDGIDTGKESARHREALALVDLLSDIEPVVECGTEHMDTWHPNVWFAYDKRTIPRQLLGVIAEMGDLRIEGTDGPEVQLLVEL